LVVNYLLKLDHPKMISIVNSCAWKLLITSYIVWL